MKKGMLSGRILYGAGKGATTGSGDGATAG
jgi:hypothetical protein